MNDKPRKIAVITGDLVNSTELGREKIERAFTALEYCAEMQADWHGAPLHFTRHRGDGWQVVLAKPEMALRSALAFRAALRAEGREYDSYIGIAEGEVEGLIGPDLNAETAEVFTDSGDALAALKLELPQRIYFHTEDNTDAIAILADTISQDWTPSQAAAVLLSLDPTGSPSQTALGKTMGKSRQAVAKSLEAAKFTSLYLAINTLERCKS